MPWNCLNKRRFEGTHTTGDEGKFFFGFQLPVTGECQQMAQCSQSKLINRTSARDAITRGSLIPS